MLSSTTRPPSFSAVGAVFLSFVPSAKFPLEKSVKIRFVVQSTSSVPIPSATFPVMRD